MQNLYIRAVGLLVTNVNSGKKLLTGSRYRSVWWIRWVQFKELLYLMGSMTPDPPGSSTVVGKFWGTVGRAKTVETDSTVVRGGEWGGFKELYIYQFWIFSMLTNNLHGTLRRRMCRVPLLTDAVSFQSYFVLSLNLWICPVSYTHLTLPTIYSV